MSEDKEIRIEVKGPEDEPNPVEQPSTDDSATADNAPQSDVQTEAVEPTETQQLKQRVAELEDKLLRTAAEFDNYRKRTARQSEEAAGAAQDKVLVELAGVVDNFERALKHSNDAADIESLRQGMDLIYSQMQDLLKRHDIEEIAALGQPFDPNLHEALLQVASAEHPPGIVALELSKGYRRGRHVLRHAKVGVSSGP